MQKNFDILLITEEHVNDVFNKSLVNLPYHNLKHTYDVVESSKIIAAHQNINELELEILLIAAWFHDIGYLKSMSDHEKYSVKQASSFLNLQNVHPQIIAKVNSCILATKLSTKPVSLVEKILADADLFDLGTAKHFKNSALLKEELSLEKNKIIEEEDWLKIEISFLKKHRYQTTFGIKTLEPIKQQHLIKRIFDLNNLDK